MFLLDEKAIRNEKIERFLFNRWEPEAIEQSSQEGVIKLTVSLWFPHLSARIICDLLITF